MTPYELFLIVWLILGMLAPSGLGLAYLYLQRKKAPVVTVSPSVVFTVGERVPVPADAIQVAPTPFETHKRAFCKALPVVVLLTVTFMAIGSGLLPSNWYSWLGALTFALSAIADALFVYAQSVRLHRQNQSAQLFDLLSVMAFFLVQIIWAVLFTWTTALSGGLDLGSSPAAPIMWQLVLPYLLVYGIGAALIVTSGKGFPSRMEGLVVALYGLAVVGSCWRASARIGQQTGAGYQRLASQIVALVGMHLFAASDSVICWNAYVRKVPYASAIIMLLYWAGQMLLMLGLNVYLLA